MFKFLSKMVKRYQESREFDRRMKAHRRRLDRERQEREQQPLITSTLNLATTLQEHVGIHQELLGLPPDALAIRENAYRQSAEYQRTQEILQQVRAATLYQQSLGVNYFGEYITTPTSRVYNTMPIGIYFDGGSYEMFEKPLKAKPIKRNLPKWF